MFEKNNRFFQEKDYHYGLSVALGKGAYGCMQETTPLKSGVALLESVGFDTYIRSNSVSQSNSPPSPDTQYIHADHH